MAKYTYTDSDLFESTFAAMSYMALPYLLAAGAVGGATLYLEYGGDLISLIVGVVFLGVVPLFILCVLLAYYNGKRLSKRLGYTRELLIHNDGLTFKWGGVRNDIPYSLVKSASLWGSYLFMKLKGGGRMNLRLTALSVAEQYKLLTRLGFNEKH